MSKFAKENIAVQCPFWKGYNYKSHNIICEGVNDRCTTHLAFADYSSMRSYTSKHCECIEGFRGCMIFDTLDYHKYFDTSDENATTND